jgi:hypothetical protein
MSAFGLSNMTDGITGLQVKLAGDNFDAIESGGTEDWIEIDGRVFLTRRWMEEIGKIKDGYSLFDYERGLAAAI